MGDVVHNPVCQYNGCTKTANDYDDRFGRLVFFCNDLSTFHTPRFYHRREFAKGLSLICGECNARWTIDGPKEETLEERTCPACEESGMMLVK